MTSPQKTAPAPFNLEELKAKIADKPIVLIGMMGAGKTSVGRRLAQLLGRDFVDSDVEIEAAAGMDIPEIFEKHGEADFRSGEARVIARLLGAKNQVLATGGGAFMTDATREKIKAEAISIFISADIELLFERVSRRSNRPLLKNKDPRGTLEKLIEIRYPTYRTADIIVESDDVPQEDMAKKIATSIWKHSQR